MKADEETTMIIDCERCEMRDIACDDCVVTVLLAIPRVGGELHTEETDAIKALSEGGLVPPLRMRHPGSAVG
jgi:hypothetical protein